METCLINKSTCSVYSITMPCLNTIYQGDSGIIQLTLLDDNNLPLDLNDIDSIELLIYGEDSSNSLLFKWPTDTHDEPITLLQSGEGTSMMNKGVISFVVPDNFTTDLIAGKLYSNISLSFVDTSYPNGIKTVSFPCMVIANIGYSNINLYNAKENQ